MAIRQQQFEEIIELLNKAVLILASEGLVGSVKDTEKLINRINGMGSIIPSHKNGLYSVLRMMLESNTYYDSKAREHLDQAFVLIVEALNENVQQVKSLGLGKAVIFFVPKNPPTSPSRCLMRIFAHYERRILPSVNA